MDAIEHLDSVKWSKPQYYGGFSPDGDYCILSRHRDADSLIESNWRVAIRDFDAQAYDDGEDGFETRPTVYHWRAGHSLMGWVEYLMVRADAPDEVLTNAGETVCALADYPILNEEDYSSLRDDLACQAWENLDLKGRMEVIDGARHDGRPVSLFAARRDYPPQDDQGMILERLTD